jgi:YD repeat-containing protein
MQIKYSMHANLTVVSNGVSQYNYSTYYKDTGQVDYTTHPLGSKVIYTYDAQGRTTQVRRENSDASQRYDTDYTFNATGELTQVDFPDGGQQKYTYDEIGRRRQTDALYTTSPSSAYITTSVEFNKNGAAKKYWDGRGNDSSTTFGLRGQTLTTTDPLSRETSVTYDKDLRTTKVDAPDSKQSRTYYDTCSRSVPASDITSGTLVPQSGRVTSRRDYLIADSTYVSVAYTYDHNSQVTVTTDQNSNEWTKTYDGMGRHRTTVTPTVSSTSECPRLRIGAPQWYDGNGNVAEV